MAIVDKTIAPLYCPLCGTAKESDIFTGDIDMDLAPKYHCGTIFWSFQKLIKVRGDKCRIIQKLRSASVSPETPTFPSEKDF